MKATESKDSWTNIYKYHDNAWDQSAWNEDDYDCNTKQDTLSLEDLEQIIIASKQTPGRAAEISAPEEEFIPAPDIFKPFLKKLLNKMSEDDARAILQAVSDAISKEDTDIRLSKSIETAIISILIAKA